MEKIINYFKENMVLCICVYSIIMIPVYFIMNRETEIQKSGRLVTMIPEQVYFNDTCVTVLASYIEFTDSEGNITIKKYATNSNAYYYYKLNQNVEVPFSVKYIDKFNIYTQYSIKTIYQLLISIGMFGIIIFATKLFNKCHVTRNTRNL